MNNTIYDTNYNLGTYSVTDNTMLTGGYGTDYLYTTTTNGADTIEIADYTTGWKTGAQLDVKGDANFEGDLKIKGKSLVKTLERIEEKLAILHPNEELETRWEELRNLREQYLTLEKELIEKEKMWSIIKK